MTDGGREAIGRARILVAAIGNPDRGDDGAGGLVAARLAPRLPPGVALLVRHGDVLPLAEECAGFDALICVDAAAPAATPGRIHRIEVGGGVLPREVSVTSSHAFGLAEALALAHALGSLPETVTVFAIEGTSFEGGAAVTPAVVAAAAEVAEAVLAEIGRLWQSHREVAVDA